ncbi:MAG: Holliday junction resolvase RuvX [Bacteroidetes bacterium]|jgi:putative Holliday junction resolvase|nr:Holliday junction resolvase RuvX [Bacteroidota bacterium]MBL0015638.1 Holliday junction resolvase RuvX [Bacteroidota bacterium]MBP6640770.1 Holliday junction resolvase RuvX [Bacteroidia bacterium]
MARIIGIDFGMKRTGLAWTDPLQIIATGLETVATDILVPHLQTLLKKEQVEKIVLGHPTRLDGSDTDTTQPVLALKKKLEATFPTIPVVLWDEQFSSKKAMRAMIDGGVSKKNRRDKALIDKVSATLILQDYLATNSL